MNTVVDLLDDWPADADRRPDWMARVELSLQRDRERWRAAAGELTRDRCWVLLGWAETTASHVVAQPRDRARRVRAIAFVFSLLENGSLDRRDVQVVAALVHRACVLARLDFYRLARRGCRRAGPPGRRAWVWLPHVPASTPATHTETGSGSTFRFERVSDGAEPPAPAAAAEPLPEPTGRSRWIVVGVVVVAALLIAGIVVLYAHGIVALPGPLVAFVLAPVVVLLSTWALRGRVRRVARALGTDLVAVEHLLERERAMSAPDRSSKASYHELVRVSADVDTALRHLTGQRDGQAAVVVIELATTLDTTWPADSPLTAALRAAARRARTLARLDRRRARLAAR